MPGSSPIVYPVPGWNWLWVMQKIASTIMSAGPWDTLSVDIVGPFPRDRRMKYIITFMDCYSKYAILIPSNDHTARTVNNTLLYHVIPYFGVSRRLLSEFTGQVWNDLLRTLVVQRVFTSPYHPEGNAINEGSHCTMDNNVVGLFVHRQQLHS